MFDYSKLRDLPDDRLKDLLVSLWKANRARDRKAGETSSSEDEELPDRLLTGFKQHRAVSDKGRGVKFSQAAAREAKSAEQPRRAPKGASSSSRPSRGKARHRSDRRRDRATREKDDSSDDPDSDELEAQILRDVKDLCRQVERKAETSSSENALRPLEKLTQGLSHMRDSLEAHGEISPEEDGPGLETRILNGLKVFFRKWRQSQAHPDDMNDIGSRLLNGIARSMSQARGGSLSSDSEAAEPTKKNPLDRLKGRQSTEKKGDDDSTEVSSDGPDDITNRQLPRAHAVRDMPPSEEGHYYAYGMVKETTAWDVYNNEARKMDNELVKDWRESLNSLLLFTAIFAALLAAFIIEAKKMLSQDPTDLLASITLWSLNNHGNTTNLPYVPAPFQASWTSVSINSLLFSSLGVTLVAALASVVSLQWVADYDAAITRGGSSPEDQAKRRQFRFAGVVDWKMGEIIAALPLLLYTSVALFWIGAIQWMWSIHYIVGYVVAGSTALAAFFYIITTFLGTAVVTTPFRTPLSRGLYWLFQPSVTSTGRLLSRTGTKTREQWIARTGGDRLSGLREYFSRFEIKLPSVSTKRLSQWINKYLIPNTTSRRREEKAAGANPRLRQEALDWLARHLPVSEDSHRRLILLITEVLNLSPESSVSTCLDDAWLKIFNFLGWHYMRQIIDNEIDEKSYGTVGLLIRCFTAPQIRDQIKPSPAYETDPAKAEYWSQCCIMTTDIAKKEPTASENIAFLLARDIPVPLTGSKQELGATMKLIKWRNSTHAKEISIWKETFSDIELYSPEYIQACLRCFKLWLFASDSPEPSEELVQTTEAFDKLMKLGADPKLHLSLVRLLSEYVEDALQQPRETPDYPEFLSRRFSELRDPCFAILGGYTYDVPVAVGVTMTKAYMNKYSRSLEIVHSLVHKKRRVVDSPAVWQLRAAIAGTSPTAMAKLCFRAAREVDQLVCIERLFQYPLHCTGHASGLQHLLYHFNCDNRSGFAFQKGKTLFGLDLSDTRAHPVLVFLAFPGPDYTSFVTPGHVLNSDCVERIREMCEDVMQHPAALIALVTDIALEHLRYECKPQSVALMLKAVERIMRLPHKDETMHRLRPMAHAIWRVREQMIGYKKCPQEEVDSMARHADGICEQLRFISTTRVVCSTSQTRLLSCARAYRSPHAAVGWLPMYEGTSKNEMRMGEFNGTRILVDVHNRLGDKYSEATCYKQCDRSNADEQGALRHHKDLACSRSGQHGPAARNWAGMYVM